MRHVPWHGKAVRPAGRDADGARRGGLSVGAAFATIRKDIQELRRHTSRSNVEPSVIVRQLDELAVQIAALRGSGEAGTGQVAFLTRLDALLAENAVTLQQAVATTAANAISGPAESIRRDVASLKEIQASVDRRTHDTFEAVYGTIERIADRLAAIEDELRERNSDGNASTPPPVETLPADDLDRRVLPVVRLAPASQMLDETTAATSAEVASTAMLRRPSVLPDVAVETSLWQDLVATEKVVPAAGERPTIGLHLEARMTPQRQVLAIGLAVAVLLLVALALTVAFYRAPAQSAGDPIEVAATRVNQAEGGNGAAARPSPDSAGHDAKQDTSRSAEENARLNLSPATDAVAVPSARTSSAPADGVPWVADSLMRDLLVPAPAPRHPWPQSSPPLGADPAASLPSTMGSKVLVAAAEAGDPGASYEVGIRLAQGRNTAQDYTRAAVFLDHAARAGLAPAQFSLGSLYEKGLGVRKDLAEARRLYLAAAAKGHAGAMHNLAVLYVRGINGRPDYGLAAEWFRKAAAYGTVDSEYNLGLLYARGEGVEHDAVEAYKWFVLAAKGGDKGAARERDEIAKSLDEKQLEAARASAENFVALPLPDQAMATRAPAGGWDEAAGAATTKSRPPARPERFPGK